MARLVVGTSKNQIRVLSLSNYEGSVETNVDEWIDHLSAPPFATNTNTVHRIGARLRPVWGQCRVTACRTQANRFFHVKCLKCGQSVFGS